jgi:hypothetical protein
MNESKYKLNWVKELTKNEVFRRIAGVYRAVNQPNTKKFIFSISGLKYSNNY